MADKGKSKLKILQHIRDQKDILFGSLSPTITKIDKCNAWEKIADEAKTLGIITDEKPYNYVRDVYWQNLRKRTFKKIDQRNSTGAAGGNESKLDEIDNLVLDIVGEFKNCLLFRLNSNSNRISFSAEIFTFTRSTISFESVIIALAVLIKI